MTRPEVHCTHCDGTGKMPLPFGSWQTLLALTEPMTANDLAAKFNGVRVTAIMNHLVRLQEWGLVSKEEGRPNVWRRVAMTDRECEIREPMSAERIAGIRAKAERGYNETAKMGTLGMVSREMVEVVWAHVPDLLDEIARLNSRMAEAEKQALAALEDVGDAAVSELARLRAELEAARQPIVLSEEQMLQCELDGLRSISGGAFYLIEPEETHEAITAIRGALRSALAAINQGRTGA